MNDTFENSVTGKSSVPHHSVPVPKNRSHIEIDTPGVIDKTEPNIPVSKPFITEKA